MGEVTKSKDSKNPNFSICYVLFRWLFCLFLQEEKKPEEKKEVEAKKPEEQKKEEEKKEEKAAGEVAKEEKKEEKEAPPPPPPEEFEYRVFMHCEGCARKVKRSLRGFAG